MFRAPSVPEKPEDRVRLRNGLPHAEVVGSVEIERVLGCETVVGLLGSPDTGSPRDEAAVPGRSDGHGNRSKYCGRAFMA